MNVNGIRSIFPKIQGLEDLEKSGNAKFGNIMTDFIGKVNSDQQEADNLTHGLMEGKDVELHEVMIAGEKAQTSLDLLIQIRNKAIDMYKELTRMQ